MALLIWQQEWNNRPVHTGQVWLRVIRFICGASYTDGVTEISCCLVTGYALIDVETILVCVRSRKSEVAMASRAKCTEIQHDIRVRLCGGVWLTDRCWWDFGGGHFKCESQDQLLLKLQVCEPTAAVCSGFHFVQHFLKGLYKNYWGRRAESYISLFEKARPTPALLKRSLDPPLNLKKNSSDTLPLISQIWYEVDKTHFTINK